MYAAQSSEDTSDNADETEEDTSDNADETEDDTSDVTAQSDEDTSGSDGETEEDTSGSDGETEEDTSSTADVTDVTDTSGHGTAVTGIIAAQTDNEQYVAGIADGAELIIIKAFDDQTSSDLEHIISALHKACEYDDLDVINMSLGATDLDEDQIALLKEPIDTLVEKGVIIIASVGNSGDDEEHYADLTYPAAFDNIIGVGAVSKNKELCYFSQRNESVFVVAPGGKETHDDSVYNAIFCLSPFEDESGGYEIEACSGTSQAAPHVAAVAAIAKSIYPELTTAQFMEILIDTSEDLGDEGYDTSYGYGFIDAEKIIERVNALANPEPAPYVYDPENYKNLSYDAETAQITVETNDTEAVVFAADYDEYRRLVSLKLINLSDLEDENGVYTYDLGDEMIPDKLFLWHGMIGCIDSWVSDEYAALATPSPSPAETAEPTETTDPAETTEPTETTDPAETTEPTETTSPALEMFEAINTARADLGLDALIYDEDVAEFALSHSQYMLKVGETTLDDEDEDGTTIEISDRFSAAMKSGVIPSASYSESVVSYIGDAASLMEAITNNAGYRSVYSTMMSTTFTHIGIGASDEDEEGRIYWTFDFYYES
ncbi:MAG: S8 family serine peptidase [Firmicutes bacterium]|nr:S8 family serine peptidase [Bacillota bacterium]